MSNTQTDSSLPGSATPYILRQDEGDRYLVAGQIARTLATTHETAGGFAASICSAPLDKRPIPLHWHEREHDTWLCTRGRLQVWCKNESRILLPGDFAYVKPGDGHSYRSIAPHTEFFGMVAPGGWEAFFREAGERWYSSAFPPASHPFDFSRMGPAMHKFGNHMLADQTYAEAGESERDQQVSEGFESFFLRAGYGHRVLLLDHLVTRLAANSQTNGMFSIHTLEAGTGATIPAHRHLRSHELIHVVAGELEVGLGDETHILHAGDSANIPAGTLHHTRVVRGGCRWIATHTGGEAGTFYETAGQATQSDIYPVEPTAQGSSFTHDAEALDTVFI